MTWPDSPITPLGGWSLTNNVLASPDGQAFGPADLLTTSQVAQIWGYSVSTVRRYADRYGFGNVGTTRVIPAARALAGPPPKGKPGRKPKG